MPRSCGADALLVSVVLSTYREVADGQHPDGADSPLAQAIRSVLTQSYPHLELVVVSDHPPAADRARIERLVARLRDVRVHYHDLPQHGGVALLGSGAKRAGIERSRGPLIAFLEADNVWDRGHLARAVVALAADARLDLVYADSIVRLAPSAPAPPLFRPPLGRTFRWSKPDWNAQARAQLLQYNFIDASEAVFRRASYEAAGPVPLTIDCDWLLWRRFLQAGRDRFQRIPVVGSYYTTTSWEQHANYFALTLVQRFGLPFDMRAKQAEVHETRTAAYERKHQP